MNIAKDAKFNPNMLKEKLGKAFDPRMLQQLGGMGNIMNMVKRKLNPTSSNFKKWVTWKKVVNLATSVKWWVDLVTSVKNQKRDNTLYKYINQILNHTRRTSVRMSSVCLLSSPFGMVSDCTHSLSHVWLVILTVWCLVILTVWFWCLVVLHWGLERGLDRYIES